MAGQWVNVVPDIIVHRRNSGDNLLALEAKKIGDLEAEAYDRLFPASCRLSSTRVLNQRFWIPAGHTLTIYNLIVDSHSMGKPNDLVQGTLDLLILKTVSLEPKHGWAIAKRIEQISNDVLQVQQGSLYPALHRLEQQGWIRAKWSVSETGREAKFYSLTAAGRSQLEKEKQNWGRLSAAINLVVESL